MKFGFSILIFAALLNTGCSSFMTWLIPDAKPITKERCEQVNVYEVGLKDGREGQRFGDRFEFWDHDCRPFKVKIDKNKYSEGYKQGLSEYCSCEDGFRSGLKDQVEELKAQFYMCEKESRKIYFWSFKEGKKFINDTSFYKMKTQFEKEYFEDLIATKAKQICADKPAEIPDIPTTVN